ncbi:hypothetical protein [Zeimonas arvi]|uniref:DUF4145 domain-containing protein n=1 Tax=Zeimonas arvi TaxID=2498847 RepID=A0A5C8NNJ5_9BURK|nr:hypothetical protein [Zeimonas arvi]TXL62465.1 hypothetical protein FHP08_18045 [Zeimonas arvi]
MRELLGELEGRLGVREGFLSDLREDPNDWSFLVRVQVFVESALGHMVLAELGRPELAKFVGALHLGGQNGLGELAFALNLLTAEERAFVKELSGLRNRFAHRIENIDRTLTEYVRSLTPHERREQMNAIMLLKDASPALSREYWESGPLVDVLAKSARELIWWGLAIFSGAILVNTVRADDKHLRQKAAEMRAGFFESTGDRSLIELLSLSPGEMGMEKVAAGEPVPAPAARAPGGDSSK